MRVNVYAEEMTDRIEIVSKVIDGVEYTGLRIYLYLPVTMYPGSPSQVQHKGPFIHRSTLKEIKDGIGQYEVDDDSSAITFWGKKDLRATLQKMMTVLDDHLILKMRNRQ